MARPTRFVPIVTALVLAATWSCTTHRQDAPSLTGPSELGTSLSVTVSPDVLRQDGASQSLVTVTARDNQGQPLRNLTLRSEITVGGVITDFGTLSARNVVTGTDGRATFTYTAPPAGPIAVDTGTIVGITVSPMGTDFGNATSKTVDIRLVPPGVIGAPPSSLRLAINLPNAVTGDNAVFTANVTDASGNEASSQVASYSWSFGDGSSAVGRTVSHTYTGSGSFAVSLTIVDVLGRIGQASSSLTVSAGVNPTATFVVSPSSPNVGQTVGFNASSSVATSGHSITSYSWDFGDLTTGSGQTTTHSYSAAGQYSVVLTTTDDVGRKGVATQNVSVGAAGLTADFNFSPSSPLKGQSVSFDASVSKASTGRTITSYAWNYDDGSTDSGVQPRHTFNNPGTFNVRLTVSDDIGQTATVSKAVTVGAATLTASFTFAPSSPLRGQTVSFDASTSRAAAGRAIATYAWNFDDGATAFGVTTVHAFNNSATFNVRLTVTDDIGQTATTTLPVTVAGAAPTASFTFTPTAPSTGQSVQFDASLSRPAAGRTITAYSWNFDDGSTGTGVSPAHIFTASRIFNVRLTVTDDFGQAATTSQAVTVGGSAPTASFTFSPSAPATGQSVAFDASSSRAAAGRTISSYSWNFDDSTALGSGAAVNHTFTTARTFAVRLTVTDDIGQTATTTQAVVVGSGAPTAAFTFSPSAPSTGQSVAFDASTSRPVAGRTITTYAWNFDDGTTGTGISPSHSFTVARTYSVRLTVTDDAGQTATTSNNVVVSGSALNPAFTFSPSVPATNQTVAFDASSSSAASGRTIATYAWNFDDGTTGSGKTVNHAFTAARTYLVRLTITDDAGQTASTTQNVVVSNVSPVSASFTFSPSAPSTGQTVAFDASSSRAASGHSITSYAWNFDDGQSGSGVTTSHVFTTTRTFVVRLTVTDDVGQTATTTQNVAVSSSSPTANFTFQPSTPTVGQTVSFDASISTAGSGRTIPSSGYSWNFGDGTSGSGVAPTHAYTAAGTYNVTLTVTDDIGQTNSRVQTVPVGTASAATASFVFSPTSPQPTGTTFTFDASQSKGSGSAAISRYQWQFLGNPNTAGLCAAPIAPSTRGAPAGPIVVVTTPTTTFTYTSAETYCVSLTVFDNQGNSAQTFRQLTIQ